MTKNIVFDMGQVLIKFDPVQIVKQAGVTGGDRYMMTYQKTTDFK